MRCKVQQFWLEVSNIILCVGVDVLHFQSKWFYLKTLCLISCSELNIHMSQNEECWNVQFVEYKFTPCENKKVFCNIYRHNNFPHINNTCFGFTGWTTQCPIPHGLGLVHHNVLQLCGGIHVGICWCPLFYKDWVRHLPILVTLLV